LVGVVEKSEDSGETSFAFGFPPGAPTIPVCNAVAIDPPTALTVLAGTDAGIYGSQVRMHGGGNPWTTNGGLASRRVFALSYLPSSGSNLLAGTDGGLFKSTDGGVTWNQVTSLTATNVFILYFDPTSASTVYAGTGRGVFKSSDSGASWSLMNTGLNRAINAIVRAPGPNGQLYAATGAGIFVWTDELEAREPIDEAAPNPAKPRRLPPRR
jgi:hypothetical protein